MPIGLCDRCHKVWLADRMWRVGLYGRVEEARCGDCKCLLREVTLDEAKRYLTLCPPTQGAESEAA